MKQLRLNFSDYPEAEQIRDIERHEYLKKKYQPHIFLLKVEGTWASMTFHDGIKHTFYEEMNLYQTFNKVKKTHPNHKMKYIINKGLEDFLREQYRKEQVLKSRQLKLFKDVR